MEKYKIGTVPADEFIDHAEGAIASPDTTQKWTEDITLFEKTKVSHNVYIFKFKFPSGFKMVLEPGQHISLITSTPDGK